MTLQLCSSRGTRAGFTLTEALLTMAVVGIISSLVVSTMTNAARDASRMVARQQQAEVQNAVNAWVVGQSRDRMTGQFRSLESIRADYNSRSTPLARFNLIGTYLDDSTVTHFTTYTSNSGKVQSDALKKAGQYLDLSSWTSGSYPKVELIYE